MKRRLYFLIGIAFLLFSGGRCEKREEQSFIIQNNSNQDIIIDYGSFYTEDTCLKHYGQEYDYFIMDKCIKPHSSKDFKGRISGGLIAYPLDTIYIEAYFRIDIDTMSCDEFKKKFPLKKSWKLTLKDAEACDWMISYP